MKTKAHPLKTDYSYELSAPPREESWEEKFGGSAHILFIISLGQRYHEGDKLAATVNCLNYLFLENKIGRVTILVADTLQAYNRVPESEEGITLEELRAILREQGQNWIRVNDRYLSNIMAPKEIKFWDDFINDANFESKKNEVEKLLEQDSNFFKAYKKARGSKTSTFISKVKKIKKEVITSEQAELYSSPYVIEEAAVYLMWIESNVFDFTLYPSKLYEAIDYLNKYYAQDTLIPIKISFKSKRSHSLIKMPIEKKALKKSNSDSYLEDVSKQERENSNRKKGVISFNRRQSFFPQFSTHESSESTENNPDTMLITFIAIQCRTIAEINHVPNKLRHLTKAIEPLFATDIKKLSNIMRQIKENITDEENKKLEELIGYAIKGITDALLDRDFTYEEKLENSTIQIQTIINIMSGFTQNEEILDSLQNLRTLSCSNTSSSDSESNDSLDREDKSKYLTINKFTVPHL